MSTAHPDRQPVPPYRRRLAEKLRAAADLLATNGWIQGAPEDARGRHCVVGAIDAVSDTLEEQGDVYNAVGRYLGVEYRVAWWNDRSGRTAEQVIAVLRETADELGGTQS
jgi:hypothetical protein